MKRYVIAIMIVSALVTISQTHRMKAVIWVSEEEIADVGKEIPAAASWMGNHVDGRVVQVDMARDIRERLPVIEKDLPASCKLSLVTDKSVLPIASMSSLVGQFFKEFALTVTFATIFSLLVSFTLTPMLASWWARSGSGSVKWNFPAVTRWIGAVTCK
ncbi:MAG: efflux RND transporter permease subunit [bacterium]|nr:efflux RND transporter permease subunit [bacterium]